MESHPLDGRFAAVTLSFDADINELRGSSSVYKNIINAIKMNQLLIMILLTQLKD